MLPGAADAWYKSRTVTTGYEISFNRDFYRLGTMRPLAEIQADSVALETQTEGLLAEIMGGMAGPSEAKTCRVYVDTSVFGGCEENEFRVPSRRLLERFGRGELILIASRTTLNELEPAPGPVRMAFDAVPREHVVFVETTDEVRRLASRYVAVGVVGPAKMDDALHIAFATLAGADRLVSWNYKHIVNDRRIGLVNAVNRELGDETPTICTPLSFLDDDS